MDVGSRFNVFDTTMRFIRFYVSNIESLYIV